ncbi:hypothetical protein HYX17_00400 [Candidatus Woesearchaeota archaeon]|nr:hypothetical protein [Candidatus Woesearchaeota archaeon]
METTAISGSYPNLDMGLIEVIFSKQLRSLRIKEENKKRGGKNGHI